jgi:hypothetical protein
MATAVDPLLSPPQSPPVPRREEALRPPARAAAPPPTAGEPVVCWEDWFAVRLWLACCVLMWFLLVAEFILAMSRK